METWIEIFLELRDKLAGSQELKKREKKLKKRILETLDEKEKRTLLRKLKNMRAERKQREQRVGILMGAGMALVLLLVVGLSVGKVISVQRAKAEAQAAAEQAEQERIAREQKEEEERIARENTPVELTFTFTGDCTLASDIAFDEDTSFTSYYDVYGADYFFKNFRSLFEADDVTVVNMEGTLSDVEEAYREPKEYAFKAPRAYSAILSGSSVEAANLANNHSQDYGEISYTDTIDELEGKGIKTFGYDEVAVIEVKGIKVGLLGIYELRDHLERKPQIKANIQKLKDQGCQYIAACFHWSNELVTDPDEYQIELGHYAIDEGADIVIGHHPHVVQGMEEYKGKTIAYSLGNFCFGGNVNPTEKDAMVLQQKVTLVKGEITEQQNTVIPISVSSNSSYNDYQPRILDGDDADRVMNKISERRPYY
ncbi:MAG: CapA family protein [Clostridiales bacterium]|nr:CapA family protein [Candidatus Blautia equi]